jgi:protease stability complex PrcB-like protein
MTTLNADRRRTCRFWAAPQLQRWMTGLARPRLWALLIAVAAAMPLTAADHGWLHVIPYSGESSGLASESFRAVRSQKEWDDLSPQLALQPSKGDAHAPAIDFEKFTVLVAALGTRPTGGFAVLVQGAFDNGGMIEVYVLEVRPGPDCTVITTVTHPIAIALIPRSDRVVRFQVDTAHGGRL